MLEYRGDDVSSESSLEDNSIGQGGMKHGHLKSSKSPPYFNFEDFM